MAENDELLRILIQLNGRQAFSPETLREIVGGGRNMEAYNLCDGSRTQADVVKTAKVDQGTFSKTATRWAQEGILFKLGSGRDTKLLHLYPLGPETKAKGQAAG